MELNQDLEDFFASTFVKITKKEEERNVQNVERELKKQYKLHEKFHSIPS